MYFLCDSFQFPRIKKLYSSYSIGFIHSNPFCWVSIQNWQNSNVCAVNWSKYHAISNVKRW